MTIEVDYRWALGGRFLVGEYEGWIDGEHFVARDVLGYDRFREEFTSYWFDNRTTAATRSTGRHDERARTLTFEGLQDDPEHGARDLGFKLTYRFTDEDHFTVEVQHEEDGRMVTVGRVKAMRQE